jgi:hypothetical protein
VSDPNNKLSRDEVRKRLAERTKSISERFEALETELPVKPSTIKRLLEHRNQIKKVAALGAGVIALALLFRKRKSSDITYQDGLDRVGEAIAREVQKNLKTGMEPDDAVHLALRNRPPVVKIGDQGGGNDGAGTISAILKQVVISLGPSVIDLLSELIKGGKENQSKK